jgi:Tol biopolymer transport system component
VLLVTFCASTVGLVGVAAGTSDASSVEGVDTCPNAAYRAGGFSAGLPDCRAYEMVTPVEKNGGDIVADGSTNVSAQNGNGLVYASRVGFGEVQGSGGVGLWQYAAFREGERWVTHALTPTPAPAAYQIFGSRTFNWAFSSELDESIVEGYDLPAGSGGIAESPNLYFEDSFTGALDAITRPLSPEQVVNPFSMGSAYRGSSADLAVSTFQTTANLLAAATGGEPKLYAIDHGVLRLAGILPDGSIPVGGSASPRELHSVQMNKDTVSNDGSRIIFLSPASGSSRQLYIRINAEKTVWVSQPEGTVPVSEPEEVQFQGATHDGRKVLFTSADRLLDTDPGTSAGEVGLYLYTESAHPETDSNLTFIARISSSGGGMGMSRDGSHIYFYSNGVVYLWDDGNVRQVAPTPEEEQATISSGEQETLVSDDGRRLAFFAGNTFENGFQLYLYDEGRNKLTCISCPSGGAPSTAIVEPNPKGTRTAASSRLYPRNFLSGDGRYAFFSTAEALVPQDTNKLPDAYEYEVDTGRVALLSPGTGSGSWFTQASPDGRDVFIVTRQSLSGWDVDKLTDIYDARVDGGLPEPPPPAVPCAGDACQGTPSAAPTFGSASEFSGSGNLVSTAKVKQRSTRRSSKLSAALRVCRKKPKRKRHSCEKHAIKRYGTTARTIKRTTRPAGR